jgi:glycerophosphoryl diester phosphodiesterase
MSPWVKRFRDKPVGLGLKREFSELPPGHRPLRAGARTLNYKLSFHIFFIIPLLLGIGAGTVGCMRNRMDEMKIPYWKGKHPVMVIAHRGFSGAAPENTLAAFRKAVEVGSDMVELDVQLSKDGKVVVIHDETLERTTTGQGKVADHTWEELKTYDAGSWFGSQFSSEKIPTLREVLDLAKGRVLVNIEIKHPNHGRYGITELADRALKETQEAGMISEVIFSSFNPEALEWINQKEPRVWVAVLYHQPWKALSDVTGGKAYPVLNLLKSHLTPGKIRTIHEQGMKINVYTVNSEEEMDQWVWWKADGIITNHPDRLIQSLENKRPDNPVRPLNP